MVQHGRLRYIFQTEVNTPLLLVLCQWYAQQQVREWLWNRAMKARGCDNSSKLDLETRHVPDA